MTEYVICSTGSRFMCSFLVVPVKNENDEVILIILNFDEISDSLKKNSDRKSSNSGR